MAQPHPRKTQPLGQHVPQNVAGVEALSAGQIIGQFQQSSRKQGGAFQRPCVLLSGGETAVTLTRLPEGAKPGRGGRAGEFCLGLAEGLQAQAGVWGLAADTDGIDGVEDNAGALVTPDTVARGKAAGLSLADHIARHDAYAYFQAIGDLVVTGPTHTNVNDFRAVLIL